MSDSFKFFLYSPRDALTFHAVPGEQDRIDFILLKNLGDRPLMYKIKTTSPENFRVRPSRGYLAPRDRTIVRIFLQQCSFTSCALNTQAIILAFAEGAAREKFLVAAAQMEINDMPTESFECA